MAHVTNLGSSNPTTIGLAKRLVDLAPPGLDHVFFSDDGATAVEVALKMAFQYWRQRGPSPFSESSEKKGLSLGTRVALKGTKNGFLSHSTGPITATRWGASASAASSGFTPCFARCCSKCCGCRRPTRIACRRAFHSTALLPITCANWKSCSPPSTTRSPPW